MLFTTARLGGGGGAELAVEGEMQMRESDM